MQIDIEYNIKYFKDEISYLHVIWISEHVIDFIQWKCFDTVEAPDDGPLRPKHVVRRRSKRGNSCSVDWMYFIWKFYNVLYILWRIWSLLGNGSVNTSSRLRCQQQKKACKPERSIRTLFSLLLLLDQYRIFLSIGKFENSSIPEVYSLLFTLLS
jgi:hypothetical protein